MSKIYGYITFKVCLKQDIFSSDLHVKFVCLLFVLPCSETRITREHDSAMNKLFDWLARFELQLNETLQSVKEFYTKDRMSEAKTYLAQLDELRDKVLGFLEEVP